jgi:hypothetical protein
MKTADPAAWQRHRFLGCLFTDLIGPRAALTEGTACREIEKRWGHSRNLVEGFPTSISTGHRTNEPHGIGMERLVEYFIDRSLFDDLARIHHTDLVCQPGDDRGRIRGR